MPRYHFHLESSIGPSADADGREMPDDTAAVREAGSTAGEVLMDELTAGNTNPRVAVTVERGDGTKVAIVKTYAEVEILEATSITTRSYPTDDNPDQQRADRSMP